jgi:cation transport regulator ChaC
MENTKTKIFGYGSLLCHISRLGSAPSCQNDFVITRLDGYKREFVVPSNHRICKDLTPTSALNITQSKNHHLNGIVFEVSGECLDNLKKRECIYDFVEINPVDKDGKIIKCFTFKYEGENRQGFRIGEQSQHDYLDICLRGAKKIGTEFENEFLKTTFVGGNNLCDIGLEYKF